MSNPLPEPTAFPSAVEPLAFASALLDALPCAIIVTDREGRATWVNRGFREMCGYEPREVLGMKPGTLLQGPGSDPEVIDRIRDAVRRGVAFSERLLNYDKRGRSYWISLDVAPLRIGDQDGFVGIARDLTQGFLESSRSLGSLGKPGHLTEAVRNLALAANEEHELHQFLLSLADAIASLKPI